MNNIDDILTDSMVSEIDNILKQVKNDPDDLKVYKKIFKKTVPFHMRSWVSAYLLRQAVAGKAKRRIPEGTSLFVSVGRNRKVYPKDLIQLFVGTGKIERDEIGEIKVLDSYSFINIKDKSAAKAIDNLDGINYRGRNLAVNFAKKKN